MDTSEQYQQMMIGAWHDIANSKVPCSLIYEKRHRILYILNGKVVHWGALSNTELGGALQAIPLLEQDQLQEMVSGSPYQILYRLRYFIRYIDWGGEFATVKETFEQLLLAFVLKENHNKTWNGDKWVSAN